MNFEEITADQVKNEIKKLIWEYPDRYGYVSDDSLYSTTYYAEELGECLTTKLVTPVCIVGMWVERFHPKLKDDPLFGGLLRRNMRMATVTNTETPLNMDVMRILVEAQEQQDKGIPWGKIKL